MKFTILLKIFLLFLVSSYVFCQAEEEDFEPYEHQTDDYEEQAKAVEESEAKETYDAKDLGMKVMTQEEFNKQLGDYESIFDWDAIREKFKELLASFSDNIKTINFNEINFKKYMITIKGITFQDIEIETEEFKDLLKVIWSKSQDHEMQIISVKIKNIRAIIHTNIKDVHVVLKNTWFQLFFTFVEEKQRTVCHNANVGINDINLDMFGASLIEKLIDKESIKRYANQMAKAQVSNFDYEFQKNHETLKNFLLDDYKALTIPKFLDSLHQLDNNIIYDADKKTVNFSMNIEFEEETAQTKTEEKTQQKVEEKEEQRADEL